MLGSFLIFLREGIEGSMIVAIICTYLAGAGRRDLFRWVFAGVSAALLSSAGAAVAVYAVVKDAFINSTIQLWFETSTFVLAVIVLTYMTFWMQRNARHLNTAITNHVHAATTGSPPLALALLAFVIVGREAIETAIFLLAVAFQNSASLMLVGAMLGLGVACAVSVIVYRMGVKLNMKRFFTVVGTALIVVAAGLLANTIGNLQELRVLPGGGLSLWNTSHFVADDSTLGDILHGLLGYSATPTILEVAAWGFYLSFALPAFWGRRPRRLLSRSFYSAERNH